MEAAYFFLGAWVAFTAVLGFKWLSTPDFD